MVVTIELSGEEKERIRAEEIFRGEVQRILAAERGQESSSPGLFDSPGRRFIATTFIIPLFIWLFTYLQAEIQESRVASRHVQQLQLEAKARIAETETLLREQSPRFIDDVDRIHFYPEFQGWKFTLVAYELQQKDSSLSRETLQRLIEGLREEDVKAVAAAAKDLGWYDDTP